MVHSACSVLLHNVPQSSLSSNAVCKIDHNTSINHFFVDKNAMTMQEIYAKCKSLSLRAKSSMRKTGNEILDIDTTSCAVSDTRVSQ